MEYKSLNFKSAGQLKQNILRTVNKYPRNRWPLFSDMQEDKRGSADFSELFFPKAMNIGLSGRSSDLSRSYEAFPFRFFSIKSGTVAGYHKTIITFCVIGHHSSGYCCGFLPHSLFIAMNQCSLQHQNNTNIDYLFRLLQSVIVVSTSRTKDYTNDSQMI